MEIDGLVVLLVLPPGIDIGTAASGLYGTLADLRVVVSPWPHECQGSGRCPRCQPADGLLEARAREADPGILDRLFPSRLVTAWRPVGAWLAYWGGQTANASGQWREVVLRLPIGVAARSAGGIGFVFGLWNQPEAGLLVELVFDWRTFNQCKDGPAEVARIVATVGSRLGALGGAGGPPGFLRHGLRAALAQPSGCGAQLVAGGAQAPGFGESRMTVNGFAVGWALPADLAQTTELVDEPSGSPQEYIPLMPQWSGCSGRFIHRPDGIDEAIAHYEKHVLVQGEWTSKDMPSVATYVSTAAQTLDALESIFEMWQPANHAVVKYDPANDLLAIGDLHGGDLRTFFRPGGSDYVLRKLRAGLWVPPPVLGCVAHDAIVDDAPLAALFSELERAIAEADVEARAAVAQGPTRMLAAVASNERVDFITRRVRTQYLTSLDEARLDAVEMLGAEAQAALDIALETCPVDALRAAVETAVDRYLRSVPDLLAPSQGEELEEVLGLRDRLEFVRMAARGRGRISGMLPAECFRDVELTAMDALVATSRSGATGPESVSECPESFIWRGMKRNDS
jgi:hypothetical protein